MAGAEFCSTHATCAASSAKNFSICAAVTLIEPMRSHAEIIRASGVPKVLLVLERAGLPVREPTVRSWLRRPDRAGCIPAGYWRALVRGKVASATELLEGAERRLRLEYV